MREVTASERTLISLTTKLRYTTMILLPDEEEILDVVCGDRDFWVISAAQHIAHVKPAKEGRGDEPESRHRQRPRLFLPADGTEGRAAGPEGVRDGRSERGGRPKKFYSAADMSACRREVTERAGRSDAAQQRADEAIASFKRQYPAACSSSTPGQVRAAVLRPLGLARRPVHVHQGRRHGTPGALRDEGRRARARELPGRARHVRRPEGPRPRISGARQGALRFQQGR